MAESFLQQVIEDLLKKNIDPASCTYIIPSKRSGIFLKKQLVSQLRRTFFSPEILSIQDFTEILSGLTASSNINLLLELFYAYKNSKVKESDDFATFLKWGNTLLQDFNEIDSHLVPVSDILNYVSAIKELDHWSLKEEKTELVENYLELWKHLENIYRNFIATLLKKKIGYLGLIQRVATEKLEEKKSKRFETPIIFVGFNALSTAEATIIQHFLNRDNAYAYWDIDSYFLNDPIHDTGLFIRKYQREWPNFEKQNILFSQNNFLSTKRITISGVPKNISQTKYVGQLLDNLHQVSSGNLDNTALVLADETLLTPMLKAVPEKISAVNITMGMPLNKTILYAFFHDFITLHLSKHSRGYFYAPVLEFLSNPYNKKLSAHQPFDYAQSLHAQIQEKNWVYLTPNYLDYFYEQSRIVSHIFPKEEISSEFWIDSSLILIDQLKEIFQKENNPLELERLYRFNMVFNQLKQYVVASDIKIDLKSTRRLFEQLASMETLDFIGEPLDGLQIMGVLESRNLDFETVLITSVNEGILPAGKSNNSFIPFDVKRDYGLPTYKEKDAIFVYHFYRLLQRAKNIFITYNTEPDVLEGGEMSRLVSQLLSDSNLTPYIKHSIVAPEVTLKKSEPIQVHKSKSLLAELRKFSNKGFSPTSLTNYIRNPIDFYTRNILNINDLDEVEENIAANTFGTILHDALELLYNPLLGKSLSKELLSGLKSTISAVVSTSFQKILPGIDIKKGQYHLVYHVIVKYLENFIDLEINELHNNTVKLIALEQRYEMNLDISELGFPVKLKGTIDRVDECNGLTRIIDYKTGRVAVKNTIIKDWGELIQDYDKSKAFQLLFYAYLHIHNNPTEELQAGIYAFKTLGKGLFLFKNENSTVINRDTLKTFEIYLKELILEICNPEITFEEKKE